MIPTTTRRTVLAAAALAAAMLVGVAAQAEQLIDLVPVGDAGNDPDDTTYGSVGYNYQIGKYEVTAAQYTAFLNAVAATDTYGLYDSSMWSSADGCKIQQSGTSGSYTYSVPSEWANRPVNYVTFWDACRCANWINNAERTGEQNASTTEDGAYTLNGYNGNDGRTITRNAGATWFIPTEDEWYKAAYYDPNKSGGAGYWDYPTKSDSAPTAKAPPGDSVPPGSANYNNAGDPTHYRTEAGLYSQSASAYGTFDQGGNVWEWNESLLVHTARVARGGGWTDGSDALNSSYRASFVPLDEAAISQLGFRVATNTPEPTSTALLVSGSVALLLWVWRRREAKRRQEPANATMTLITDQGAPLGQSGDEFTFYLAGQQTVPAPSAAIMLAGRGVTGLAFGAARRRRRK